jgi:hypothetical protein
MPIQTLLLLAMAPTASIGFADPPCVPVASDRLAPTTSAIEDHKYLRKALGEPMPETPTMIMMHGQGGHLSTQEYSVVLARGADDVWHGTAVGRSQIWVEGAPYTPMKRIEWALDKEKGQHLDDAISRFCRFDRSSISDNKAGAPRLSYVGERIDVVLPGQRPVTYNSSDGDGVVASLIRPPQ